MRAHIAICINILTKNSDTHRDIAIRKYLYIKNKFKMFNVLSNINLKNVNCLNMFVKLKDQIILQNKITFEISLVTTKN